MTLTPKDLRLVSHLLEMASDVFSNHGCNDFDLSKAGFTKEEAAVFVRAYMVWNDKKGGEKEFLEMMETHHGDLRRWLGDSTVMSFLAHKLEDALEPKPQTFDPDLDADFILPLPNGAATDNPDVFVKVWSADFERRHAEMVKERDEARTKLSTMESSHRALTQIRDEAADRWSKLREKLFDEEAETKRLRALLVAKNACPDCGESLPVISPSCPNKKHRRHSIHADYHPKCT